jgi:hypothetical protein
MSVYSVTVLSCIGNVLQTGPFFVLVVQDLETEKPAKAQYRAVQQS